MKWLLKDLIVQPAVVLKQGCQVILLNNLGPIPGPNPRHSPPSAGPSPNHSPLTLTQVMLLKNLDAPNRLVNGTRGVVIGFEPDPADPRFAHLATLAPEQLARLAERSAELRQPSAAKHETTAAESTAEPSTPLTEQLAEQFAEQFAPEPSQDATSAALSTHCEAPTAAPSQAEPSQAEPSQAEPSQGAPSQGAPSQAAPTASQAAPSASQAAPSASQAEPSQARRLPGWQPKRREVARTLRELAIEAGVQLWPLVEFEVGTLEEPHESSTSPKRVT